MLGIWLVVQSTHVPQYILHNLYKPTIQFFVGKFHKLKKIKSILFDMSFLFWHQQPFWKYVTLERINCCNKYSYFNWASILVCKNFINVSLAPFSEFFLFSISPPLDKILFTHFLHFGNILANVICQKSIEHSVPLKATERKYNFWLLCCDFLSLSCFSSDFSFCC